MKANNVRAGGKQVTTARRIAKNLSLEQAERYQNRLYGKYDVVRLVGSPPAWKDTGLYVWEVENTVIVPAQEPELFRT